jgi:hypothetical protein
MGEVWDLAWLDRDHPVVMGDEGVHVLDTRPGRRHVGGAAA